MTAPEAPGRRVTAPSGQMTGESAEVRRIWSEALGLADPDPDDNFFVLGGDSMAAAAILARIHERLGRELVLRDLFETGTLRAFTLRVAEAGRSTPVAPPVPARAPLRTESRASVSQEWHVQLSQHPSQRDASSFLVHAAIRVHGPLDAARLRQAIDLVASRHRLLRTGFQRRGSRVYGTVEPSVEIPLAHERIDPGRDAVTAVGERIEAEAARPFDLGVPPLVRFHLFELGPADHVLAVFIEHLICDGVSLKILMEDLSTAYGGLKLRAGFRLPEAEYEFADWAAWQRERLRGAERARAEEYWRKTLGPDPRVTTTPFRDYVAPPAQRAAGVVRQLREAETAALRATAHRAHLTLFALFAGGFLATLADRVEDRPFSVLTALANRDSSAFGRVFGLLSHDTYLRAPRDLRRDVVSLSTEMQRVTEEAIRYGFVPNTTLLESLWPDVGMEIVNAPSSYLSINRPWLQTFRLMDARVSYFDPPPQTPMPGLECTVIDTGPQLRIEIAYLDGSFPEGYVAEFCEEMAQRLLRTRGEAT